MLILLTDLSAKTVKWIIKPSFENLSSYSGDILKYKSNSKQGLIDLNDCKIQTIDVDSVSVLSEGISLFLDKEGSMLRITGIMDIENKTQILLNKKYYLNKYSYFSEGKLCVSDKDNNKGFLNKSGEEVIRCRFKEARPFKEGYSSVIEKEYKVMYIDDKYETKGNRPLIIEYRNGDISFGSSFHNGKALIGYNTDFIIMGKNGKKIENYKYKGGKLPINPYDFTMISNEENSSANKDMNFNKVNSNLISLFDNDKYGFMYKDEKIVPSQFEKVNIINDNYAIVSLNGKFGVIKVIEGDFISEINTETINLYYNTDIETCKYSINLPSEILDSEISLFINTGEGNPLKIKHNIKKDKIISHEFSPFIKDDDTEITNVIFELYSDNILLFNEKYKINVKYPLKLKIDDFMTSRSADINGIQSVKTVVKNEGRKEVTTKAVMSISSKINSPKTKTELLKIRPGANAEIEIFMSVNEKEYVGVNLKLDTGDSKAGSVILDTYY